MKYTVEISKKAYKDIRSLPKNMVQRVITKIRSLEDNPTPQGCKKIVGTENTWRVRVGNYRIIYDIYEEVLFVEVVKIAHRKDAYN